MTILRSEGSGETSTGFFSHTIDQSLKLDDASFETFKKLSDPAREFGIT